MNLRRFKTFLFAAGLCVFAGSAAAQSNSGGDQNDRSIMCAPLSKALEFLKTNMGESPTWMGNSAQGYSIMVTESDHGTWTVLLIRQLPGAPSSAIACILADEGAKANAAPQSNT